MNLVSAGLVLRGHEEQARSCSRGLCRRRRTARLQDSDDCGISRDNANSDRGDYRNAENQRHEKRNHGQPPCPNRSNIRNDNNSDAAASTFVYAASSIYLR